MALYSNSPESAQDALRNSGFYCEKDPLVGSEFSRMQREDFGLLSKKGLEFYEINISNKEHVRSVLDSMLPGYGLARCRHFHSDRGHSFRFRSGGERASLKSMVVLLWAKASKATFYRGSHQLDTSCVDASNGLFEIPAAQLEPGKAEWFTFEHGGLTIQDDRTVFEIVHGTPIAAIFATQDELTEWPGWALPKTPDVVQKVAEMNRTRVTLKALFVDPNTPDIVQKVFEMNGTRVPLNALFVATGKRPSSVAAPEDDPCPYCWGIGIDGAFICGKCGGYGNKHATRESNCQCAVHWLSHICNTPPSS